MYKLSILAYLALTASTAAAAASPADLGKSHHGASSSSVTAVAQAEAPTAAPIAEIQPSTAEAGISASAPAGISAACTEQLAAQKVTVTKPVGRNGKHMNASTISARLT